MTNELSIVKKNIFNFNELEKIGIAMVKSGYFVDIKQSSQALVKILAGREMGFEPFTSMNGVHVIQGKPVISANLMASAIKRTNKYNYNIKKMDDTEVVIEFLEYRTGKWESVGISSFDMTEAQKAGLATRDNWKKYPRNMLFARAISNGIKWFCPDALNGSTVYTPDELGAEEDEEGRIINATAIKGDAKEAVTVSSEESGIKTEFNFPIEEKYLIQATDCLNAINSSLTINELKTNFNNAKNFAKKIENDYLMQAIIEAKDKRKDLVATDPACERVD